MKTKTLLILTVLALVLGITSCDNTTYIQDLAEKKQEAQPAPPPPGTVETPTASPAAGTYTAAQNVTLICATAGADIFYTTDGSAPSGGSTPYTGPIAVAMGTTLKAIAVKAGMFDSGLMEEQYTQAGTVVKPTASPVGDTYKGTQNVSLTTSTTGAAIYYTEDGSTPTTSSTPYSGAISITATTTLQAIAVYTGMVDSAVMTEIYTIDNTPPGGVGSLAGTVGNGTVVLSWTEPSDTDFAKVSITWMPTHGITQPHTVNKGVQTATITGLTNGTAYTFTVKSVDNVGNEESSGVTTSSLTPIAPLAGTVSISGSAVENYTLTADTTGITNANGTPTYVWKRDGTTVVGTNSTYTLVTADVGKTITVTVSYSGNSGDLTGSITGTVVGASYGIGLSISGTHAFPEVDPGYGAQTAKSVTVTNTGNQATGALTVGLSGTNSGSFTLSPTSSVGSIAVGSTGSFTVVPNTGLLGGTYTATVTVSGSNGISASFDVSFTVLLPLVGTITLSPSSPVGVGVQLSANYSGTEGVVSYRWKKDGSNVATGGTAANYTPTDSGNYTVTVSLAGYHDKDSTTSIDAYKFVKNVSSALTWGNDFKALIDGAAGQTATITLYANASTTSYIYLNTSGTEITLIGNGAREISQTYTGYSLFYIGSGNTLILGIDTANPITIKGGNFPGSNVNGGSVHVVNGGKFFMNGGVITGNNFSNASQSRGAGVYVATGGEFTMEGGSITKNILHAQYVGSGSGCGGGVFVAGTFTFKGGTISENTNETSNGGGVYVASTGNFIWNAAGIITNNKATRDVGSQVYKVTGGNVSGDHGSISSPTSNNANGTWWD